MSICKFILEHNCWLELCTVDHSKMLLKQFIFISIYIFCVTNGSDESNNETQNNLENQIRIQNEENLCEVKMSAALSIMKTELLSIYKKMDTLEKNNQDLEENIRNKFHNLQKNILDKLEEYMEGKFDSLEKSFNRRIDALDNNIPDKTDILIIEQKFDALKKMYSKPDDNLHVTCKLRTNQSLLQVNDKINYELKTTDIKANTDHEVDKQILENTNMKLSAMENNILSLKHNITNEINALNNTLTQNMKKLEDEMSKKRDNVNRTYGFWDCKKQEVQSYKVNLSRIDNENLNYVTLKTNSDGISYFKMHFAAKGTYLIMVQLSAVEIPGKKGTYFALDIGEGDKTRLYLTRQTTNDVNSVSYENNLHMIDTPGILSSTKYKTYYVKIEADEMEFGETATNSSPVFKYKDTRFKSMKYFGFASYSSYSGTILYDCPPQYEETLRLV